MHDLETIKRLNRNPSKRSQPGNRHDKPAPQPAREESAAYCRSTLYETRTFAHTMQSPAMERAPLDE